MKILDICEGLEIELKSKVVTWEIFFSEESVFRMLRLHKLMGVPFSIKHRVPGRWLSVSQHSVLPHRDGDYKGG